MEYAAWKLRRQILANGALSDAMVRTGLILVEVIDWHTGVKTFETKRHFQNWLHGIARTWDIPEYNNEEKNIVLSGAEALEHLGIHGLERLGYATFEKGTLTLIVKDEWGDESDAS